MSDARSPERAVPRTSPNGPGLRTTQMRLPCDRARQSTPPRNGPCGEARWTDHAPEASSAGTESVARVVQRTERLPRHPRRAPRPPTQADRAPASPPPPNKRDLASIQWSPARSDKPQDRRHVPAASDRATHGWSERRTEPTPEGRGRQRTAGPVRPTNPRPKRRGTKPTERPGKGSLKGQRVRRGSTELRPRGKPVG